MTEPPDLGYLVPVEVLTEMDTTVTVLGNHAARWSARRCGGWIG
jgi:hypothetical protein